MISSWIKVGWVSKFSVVIFGVQGSLSCFSDLNKVLVCLLVGEILVQVVLKMLNKIHMVLDEVVSSDSWEGECIIVQLPGVNINSWMLSLSKELIVDLKGLVVMLSFEFS